jgi:hypothetical protein
MSIEASADKLVKIYVKIRDERYALEKQIRELEEQEEIIKSELANICKEVGTDGLKTSFGTVSRTLKKRYWTSDWQSFYEFIKEHDAFHFLHQRISDTNVQTFLEENPDMLPLGLNVEAEHSITVRRSK